jgi:hypothetical protein
MPSDVSSAARQRLSALFNTGGMGFRDLAVAHVASTFGDTLVAIALADTLFFAVPSAEARGNVLLYLLLTIAPFAIIGPLLGQMLDRRRAATKGALVGSALLRVLATIFAIWLLNGVLLFPVAFALLLLSRVHGIARNALLPVALDQPTELVAANARLAMISVVGGVAAAPVGFAAAFVGGGQAALVVAVLAYAVAAASGRLLPRLVDTTSPGRRRRPRVPLPRHVRLAQLATAVVRLLNGFLLFLLAFAFKDIGGGILDLGAVLAAGGGGFALAALTSPRLARRLREEPMVVAALAVEAAAAFIAAQIFGLPAGLRRPGRAAGRRRPGVDVAEDPDRGRTRRVVRQPRQRERRGRLLAVRRRGSRPGRRPPRSARSSSSRRRSATTACSPSGRR